MTFAIYLNTKKQLFLIYFTLEISRLIKLEIKTHLFIQIKGTIAKNLQQTSKHSIGNRNKLKYHRAARQWMDLAYT